MRSTVTDLNSRVPGTCYTARQVCRVKQTKKPLKPGSLLAYVGAYDNKYVVVSIKLIKKNTHYNLSDGFPTTYYQDKKFDVYEIVTRRLGKFFADGRLEPSPTYNQHKTSAHTANVPVGEKLTNIRGTRFRHVEPSGKPILPLNPCNTMTSVEKHMLHLAHMTQDPARPWTMKYPPRHKSQQQLLDDVKNRTFKSLLNYPKWMEKDARVSLKKQAINAEMWKAKNLASKNDGFGLQMSPIIQDPEAVLAMFRL